MFRTLIVDDDFLVRSYLKTLKSWEKAGYEIFADVQDGEEALEVIKQADVDVLVTDISMPVMDGIELIRNVKEHNPGVYIIVLSCHDDFNYVKESMQLGADEYVLKNALDEDSLLPILEKSAKQIQKKKEKSWEVEYKEKLIRMGSHTLKYHFFNGLISGMLTGKEREEKRQEAGIFGKFMNSAVINMFMHEWNEINHRWSPLEAEEYTQTFRHTLRNTIESLLEEESGYVEIIYLGAGVFCCFLDLSSMCRNSIMKQRLMNAASVCFRHCEGEPYRFGIGVSSICFGEDGIRQAYQQVRELMKLSFYEDSGILYYDGMKPVTSSIPEKAEELEEHIDVIRKHRNQEELTVYIAEVLDEAEVLRTDGRLLIQWLKKLDRELGVDRTADSYTNIWNLDQLRSLLSGYAEEVFAENPMISKELSTTVYHAVEYIHKNYQKVIGLQDAADAAGVNSAYLSYIFKQEMGIGFSNYLQEKRMDHVKKLLLTTNDKIKDIALEAGFHDYHYFSKLFKKLYNCSPAEYRKRKV